MPKGVPFDAGVIPVTDRLYDVAEVAEMLRISKSQLYGLVRQRLVPHRRVRGVSIRFSYDDIQKILNDSYRPAIDG